MKQIPRDQGESAIAEFGFDSAELDSDGAPTLGQVADRLADIITDIVEALVERDRVAVGKAIARLRRLRLALEVWDARLSDKRTADPKLGVKHDDIEKLQRMVYLYGLTSEEEENAEDVFEEYCALQEELMAPLLPIMKLLCESGILTACCQDDKERFVMFHPEQVYENGGLRLLCRKISTSNTEMPQFRW